MPAASADTILVVEDDPGIRELLSMALHDEGFKVQEAEDGAAAIRAIDQHRPPPEHLCVILLDLMLPKASGLEVMTHLADLGAYVPVVAMSANPSLLRAAADAGAEDTLSKPFDVDRLIEVVGRCCPH